LYWVGIKVARQLHTYGRRSPKSRREVWFC
jgi:hypothetical protein